MTRSYRMVAALEWESDGLQSLQVPVNQPHDDALDGEVAGVVYQDRGDAGIVASEDDRPPAVSPFDVDAFERRLAVDEAGADPTLHMLGFDVGAVVD